jgi:hypothetical protein
MIEAEDLSFGYFSSYQILTTDEIVEGTNQQRSLSKS